MTVGSIVLELQCRRHPQVQHLQDVSAVQKRALEHQKHQTTGAQEWAHQVADRFEGTMTQLREAAGEELAVQQRRFRVWEEEFEKLTTAGAPRGGAPEAWMAEVRTLIESERRLLKTQLTLLTDATTSVDVEASVRRDLG